MENQSIVVQVLAALAISSISGLLGVYLQKLWSSRKPKINLQSIGFHGEIIKIDEETATLSKDCSWGKSIEGYLGFEDILDYEREMSEYAAELERAREESSAWLKNNVELKNSLTLTRSALDICPYLQNAVIGSFFNGQLRRRNEINLPTALESIEKLDDIYSIARENEEEIVIHHGRHATRFTIDKDFREQEKLNNKIIAFSFLKGESENIFFLMESFVSKISEDILKIKSLRDKLHKVITKNACLNFTAAFSNIGKEPHLFMPRAYVEIMYGDDKKLILVSHKLSHKGESSELAQLIQQGNRKPKKQKVYVDSFLDKTDLSPHILIGGDSTINVSFFSDEVLGNSAENIINFYRIGGLKARLAICDANDTIFTSNLTLFTKSTSDEQREKMRAKANKALQRTSR